MLFRRPSRARFSLLCPRQRELIVGGQSGVLRPLVHDRSKRSNKGDEVHVPHPRIESSQVHWNQSVVFANVLVDPSDFGLVGRAEGAHFSLLRVEEPVHEMLLNGALVRLHVHGCDAVGLHLGHAGLVGGSVRDVSRLVVFLFVFLLLLLFSSSSSSSPLRLPFSFPRSLSS